MHKSYLILRYHLNLSSNCYGDTFDPNAQKNTFQKSKISGVMCHNCHLSIPPIIICFIYASCYYIYVLSFCTIIKISVLTSCLLVLGLNILFFMTIWSFFVTVFTPLAVVPRKYEINSEDLNLLHGETPMSILALCDHKNLEIYTRTPRNHIR